MPWIQLRHLPAPQYLHLCSVGGSLRSTPAATAQHPAGRARAGKPGSRLTPAAEARPGPCTEAIIFTRPSSRSLSAPQPAGSGDLPPARRLGQPAAPFPGRGTARYLRGLAAREGLGRAAVRTHLRRPSRRLSDTVASWGEKAPATRPGHPPLAGPGLRWPLCACASARPGFQGHSLQRGQLPTEGSRAAGAAAGPMSRRCPRRDCPGHRPPCFCSLFFFAFPSFRPFPQNTTFPPSVPLPFLLRGR